MNRVTMSPGPYRCLDLRNRSVGADRLTVRRSRQIAVPQGIPETPPSSGKAANGGRTREARLPRSRKSAGRPGSRHAQVPQAREIASTVQRVESRIRDRGVADVMQPCRSRPKLRRSAPETPPHFSLPPTPCTCAHRRGSASARRPCATSRAQLAVITSPAYAGVAPAPSTACLAAPARTTARPRARRQMRGEPSRR